MQIEKHRKRNVIVEAIREGLVAIGRAHAQQGQQIFLVPPGWEPGDCLVAAKVTRIIEDPESQQKIALADDGEQSWGFWL
jgi:hypothetical protein